MTAHAVNMRNKIFSKGILSAVMIFCAAMLFYGSMIVSRPLYTRGEAREAIVAQAMIEQVNFILPLRNGTEVPSKPPLFHWLALGASALCGGLTSFSVRLPSVVAAGISLSIFFFWIRNHLTTRQSWLATLILASNFEFVRNSSHARVDMCFTAAFSAAAYFLFSSFEIWFKDRSYRWSYLLGAALALAAAVLTKGPAAILLFCTLGTCYFGIVTGKNVLRSATQIPWVPVLLTSTFCLLVSGSWYWLAYIEENSAFLNRQIFAENIGRVISLPGTNPGHQKPFYFVFIDFLTGMLPWSLFLPIAVNYVWREKGNLRTESHRLQVFCLVWLGTFLLAVASSLSKRPVYLLPAYPAVAVLLAVSLDRRAFLARVSIYSNRFVSLFLLGCATVLALISVVTILAGVRLDWFKQGRQGLRNLRVSDEFLSFFGDFSTYLVAHSGFFLAVTCLVALILLSANMLWRNDNRGYPSLGIATAIAMHITTFWIINWDAQRKDQRNFAEASKQLIPAETPLHAYQVSTYPLRFYFGRDITEVGSLEDFSRNNFNYAIIPTRIFPELLERSADYRVLLRAAEFTERGNDHLLLVGRK